MKYKIKLNDEVYEIEIEKIDEIANSPKVEKVIKQSELLNDNSMSSPMAGIVQSIFVEDGANVVKGQKILILEAMKMENEIQANKDGKIKLFIEKGQSITGGELLFNVE